MDRETTLRMIAAIALSFAVLIAWQQLFGPAPPAPGTEPPGVTAEEDGDGAAPPIGDAGSYITGDAPGEPAPGEEELLTERVEGVAGSEPIEIRTSAMELVFSPRGARLLSVRLLDHKLDPGAGAGAGAGAVVDLVSPESRRLDLLPLTVVLPDSAETREISEAWFVVEEEQTLDGSRALAFRFANGTGLEVVKRVTIPGDGRYLMRVEWDARRRGRSIESARLAWGPGIGRPIESSSSNRFAYRGYAVVAESGDVDRYAPEKLDGDLLWDRGGRPDWLALDTQYFAVALVPDAPAAASVRGVAIEDAEEPGLQLLLETGARELTVFAGPKFDTMLREIDADLGTSLAELVDWGIFEVLARPLYVALAFFERLSGNWGIAIILLTFVIKVLFFPLTQRAMVNMRRTQEKMGGLQPKIRKVKEKYRDKKDMESRRKMQEEMMGVYKEAGVNPMAPVAGCLPLLLQLPVLYGMYSVLSVVIDMRGAPFALWIHDLSAADPYWFGLPMIMGATMLGQQVLSLTKVEDPQQKAQQRMMLIMPVMFTYFFIYLPSGLVLYWLTNNVLGIAQQVLINRQAAAMAGSEKGGDAGGGRKKDAGGESKKKGRSGARGPGKAGGGAS